MLVCEEIQRGARMVGYFALDHSIDACESNTSETTATDANLCISTIEVARSCTFLICVSSNLHTSLDHPERRTLSFRSAADTDGKQSRCDEIACRRIEREPRRRERARHRSDSEARCRHGTQGNRDSHPPDGRCLRSPAISRSCRKRNNPDGTHRLGAWPLVRPAENIEHISCIAPGSTAVSMPSDTARSRSYTPGSRGIGFSRRMLDLAATLGIERNENWTKDERSSFVVRCLALYQS